MSGPDEKLRRCIIVLAIFLILFAVIGFGGAIAEYYRAVTYVEDSCLVLDAMWEKCAVRGGGKQPRKQCYRPQWFVQFKDETQATIAMSKFEYCTSYTREDDVHRLPFTLEKYQVSMVKCREYDASLTHSPRWGPPVDPTLHFIF
jgi:hypothetical protein